MKGASFTASCEPERFEILDAITQADEDDEFALKEDVGDPSARMDSQTTRPAPTAQQVS